MMSSKENLNLRAAGACTNDYFLKENFLCPK